MQISDVKDRGYLNRVVPPDPLQADALAEHMSRTLKGGAKGKTVNIGYLDETYGKAPHGQRSRRHGRHKGGTVGRKVTYRPDSTIFTAQAKQLLEGKPDAWVFFDFLDTLREGRAGDVEGPEGGLEPTQDLRHGLARQSRGCRPPGPRSPTG